jgi:hypothetical protein
MTSSICKNCYFAIYRGKTQTGCDLGRIDKFREIGTEIIEAYDESDTEFYVVSGRRCNTYRNQEWFEKNTRSNIPLKELVRKEEQRIYDIIVLTHDNDHIENILHTVNTASIQTVAPLSIIIGINDENILVPLINALKSNDVRNWKIASVLEDAPQLDEAVKSVIGVFYAVFHAGSTIPPDFLQNVDDIVNERLYPFSLILPNHKNNGMVVRYNAYKMVGGGDVVEKIQQEVQNNPPKINPVLPCIIN